MRVEGLGAARTMLIALTTGWALRSLGAWGPRLVAPRYAGSSTSSETLEIVDPTNGYHICAKNRRKLNALSRAPSFWVRPTWLDLRTRQPARAVSLVVRHGSSFLEGEAPDRHLGRTRGNRPGHS